MELQDKIQALKLQKKYSVSHISTFLACCSELFLEASCEEKNSVDGLALDWLDYLHSSTVHYRILQMTVLLEYFPSMWENMQACTEIPRLL